MFTIITTKQLDINRKRVKVLRQRVSDLVTKESERNAELLSELSRLKMRADFYENEFFTLRKDFEQMMERNSPPIEGLIAVLGEISKRRKKDEKPDSENETKGY